MAKFSCASIILLGFLSIISFAQQQIKNQFTLNAASFDTLIQHNKNCTAEIDELVSVIYCEDGYFYICDTDSFVNPFAVFQTKANITFDFKDKVRDVRLSDIITIVDNNGASLTAIRKTDLKRHQIQLNSTSLGLAASQSTQIIGGEFSNDFITVFVKSNDQQFLQVH